MKSPEYIEELCQKQNIVQSEDKLGYENVGDFESFRCFFCLEPFKTWEEKQEHQKANHKEGDYSAQMDAGWIK